MVSYERGIGDKLLILRLVFIILAIGLLVSIKYGHINLHYLIIVALIFGAIFKVTNITIFNKNIKVKRYFVFGLLAFTWIYDSTKNNIQLYNYYDEINTLESDTPLDIIGIFFPTKVKFQFMAIQSHTLNWKLFDINVKLSDYESLLIKEIAPERKKKIDSYEVDAP